MTEETPESGKHLNRNAALIALALLAVNAFAPQIAANLPHIPPDIMHYLQLAGIPIHIFGRVMDSITTEMLQEAAQISTDVGVPQVVMEGSPIIPDQPKIKDLLHPRVLAVDLAELMLTNQIPLYGFVRAGASLYGALNNIRYRKMILKNMRDGLRKQ